jgi:TolA-binding protein
VRWRLARLLEGAGDNLHRAKLKRSARVLYQQALLFDPKSARLARLAREPEAAAGAAAAAGPRRRPPARLAEVAWLLSQVQLAVTEGRYLRPHGNNALHFLSELKRIDPAGKQTLVAQQTMTRTLRQQADQLFDQGKHDEARGLYRLIANLDPKDTVARVRAKDQLPQAPKVRTDSRAKVAAQERPTRADRAKAAELVKEGRQLLGKGKLGDAEGRFNSAVEAHPNSAGAVVGLATVAFEREKYGRAVKLARRGVRMNPRSRKGLLVLGDAYFNLVLYRKALAAWERVLAMAPDDRKVLKRIAYVKAKIK